MHWTGKIGELRDRVLPRLPSLTLLYKLFRNFAYALWNLALAVWAGSFWYLTAGVWHGLLGGVRTAAAVTDRRGDGGGQRLMRFSGILLLCLGVVVSGTVVLSIRERIADVKGLIPVIGTAAFTFFKLTAAVVKTARRKKDRTPLRTTLRAVALADASMAMLTLERTMIASLDEDGADASFFLVMTASLGMAVFLVMTALGIVLLVRAGKLTASGGSGPSSEDADGSTE